MADVFVSVQAYCKLVLHAAKYPHLALNGILLAKKTQGKEAKSIEYVDAIPLFHQSIYLAPMMEVALTQVDAYCASRGLVIAGYYQANESLTQSQPNTIAYRIADRIHSQSNDSYLFMIDNKKMSLDCESPVYHVYQPTDEGKWTEVSSRRVSLESGSLETASSLLQSKYYRDLVDFDNHLDDITLDWQNREINDVLKHAT